MDTRTNILAKAILVFGNYGFRKTTVDELATAAGLSKQGLYLHFSGKEEIYIAAVDQYLAECLRLATERLHSDDDLRTKVTAALENWFGRHKDTFSSNAYDVITLGNQLTDPFVESYIARYKALLTRAIQASLPSHITKRRAAEISETLFVCGLSWKEIGLNREAFTKRIELCVRVCLPEEIEK